MMEPSDSRNTNETGMIDVKGFLHRLIANWKWVAFSLTLAIIIGFIQFKSTKPVFGAKSVILIEERKNRSFMQEMDLFDNYIGVENAMAILSSDMIMRNVVDSLQLNIRVFKKGLFRSNDITEDSPLLIILSSKVKYPFQMEVSAMTEQGCSLTIINEGKASESIEYTFGEEISKGGTLFKLARNPQSTQNAPISIQFSTTRSAVDKFSRTLKTRVIGRKSTAIELSITSPNNNLGSKILDMIMDAYVALEISAIDLKSTEARNLIETELQSIYTDLSLTENKLEEFRLQNAPIDINRESNSLYDRQVNLEKQLAEINIKLQYYKYIEESVEDNDKGITISPSTAEISDPILNNLVLKYNDLTAKLMTERIVGSEINPNVQTLKEQRINVLEAIKKSISNFERTSQLGKEKISAELKDVKVSLSRLPKNERELTRLKRDNKLNEELYVYLLKRKSEAEISNSSASSSTEILKFGTSTGKVKPNLIITVAGSIVAGIGFPLAFLFLLQLFFPIVFHAGQIQESSSIPIIHENAYSSYSSSSKGDVFGLLHVRISTIMNRQANPSQLLVSTWDETVDTAESAVGLAKAEENLHKNVIIVDLRSDVNGKALSDINFHHVLDLRSKDISAPDIDELLKTECNQYDQIVICGPALGLSPLSWSISSSVEYFLIPIQYGRTKLSTIEKVESFGTANENLGFFCYC